MIHSKTLSVLLLLVCNVVVSAQINLTQGLKLYFPFNGSAIDASGNGNAATVNGPVLTTDRFGAASSAYYFDGVDDFISFTEGPGMKPQYPFSFSCWMNLVSPGLASDVNFIFCNDYTIPGDDYYGAIFNAPTGGNFQASVGDGGPVGPTSRNTKTFVNAAPVGSWHHFAAVVYGPNNMRLFLDCAEQNATYSGTGTGLVYSTGQGMMGRGNGGSGENYLNAELDEIRFYDRALNDQEIAALFYYPQYPPALLFDLPTHNLTIQCGSSVNIDATFQGIVSYSWNDGTQGPTKTFTTPGTYIITVDDGCLTNTDTVTVTGSILPPQISVNAPALACIGDPVTITASGSQNYAWSPATGLNTTNGATVIATIADTTTYTVIGSDACGSDTLTFTLNAINASTPGFVYSQNNCTGAVQMQYTGTPAATFLWVWENGSSALKNPVLSFYSIGDHNVTLITNPNTTCADTLTMNVYTAVVEEPSVYIPNAFTPNNDGINDYFKVYADKDCLTGELFIYNRWGEVVFHTDNPFNVFWNGRFRAEFVPNGVYAYRLVLANSEDRLGKIVLVR